MMPQDVPPLACQGSQVCSPTGLSTDVSLLDTRRATGSCVQFADAVVPRSIPQDLSSRVGPSLDVDVAEATVPGRHVQHATVPSSRTQTVPSQVGPFIDALSVAYVQVDPPLMPSVVPFSTHASASSLMMSTTPTGAATALTPLMSVPGYLTPSGPLLSCLLIPRLLLLCLKLSFLS